MRLLIRFTVVAAILGGIGAAAYKPALEYWKNRNRVEFRLAKVESGEIVAVVNATGTVKPILSVHIGAFVSGPIDELFVDFNDKVSKGDLLAKIDPRIYKASVARDTASRITAEADVQRVTALRQQAINDEKRANQLLEENEDYISDAEMDQVRFNRQSLEAQLEVAKANVQQALAGLDNSLANLGYTEITSPVDGIVIDRKIDPGQTLASQFQAPELFVIAVDLDREVHIYASVDEADIGQIQKAQAEGQPVEFTVDAHPDDLFTGTIYQIRMSSESMQNVVTYPVVVRSSNEAMKLLPGMTASLSFQTAKQTEIRKIPNAALRFYPKTEHVREQDKKILEGSTLKEDDEEENQMQTTLSATEKAEANRKRTRRHVWILEGDKLKAVEIQTGISDNKFTELLSGDLKEGDELVTGIKTGDQ